MKYVCYYNESVGNGLYIGKRVDMAVFDNEKDAEIYCKRNIGISGSGENIREEEMMYDEMTDTEYKQYAKKTTKKSVDIER